MTKYIVLYIAWHAGSILLGGRGVLFVTIFINDSGVSLLCGLLIWDKQQQNDRHPQEPAFAQSVFLYKRVFILVWTNDHSTPHLQDNIKSTHSD